MKECQHCNKIIPKGRLSANELAARKFCNSKCRHGFGISEETRKKMSISRMGKVPNQNQLTALQTNWIGRKHTVETRLKMSDIAKKNITQHHWWKGGKSNISKALRDSILYRLWREAVLERDSCTCVHCGQIGGQLHADHIKSFASIIERIRLESGARNLFENCIKSNLLWDISNGRTLCFPCHKQTLTYARNLAYHPNGKNNQ